jgi:hypothetical protein
MYECCTDARMRQHSLSRKGHDSGATFFYLLLEHPRVYGNLKIEIDETDTNR